MLYSETFTLTLWHCIACVICFKLRTFDSWSVWVNATLICFGNKITLHVQFSTCVSPTLDRLMAQWLYVFLTQWLLTDYEQYAWHILQPKHTWAMSCINPCVCTDNPCVCIMSDRFDFQQQRDCDIRLWSIFSHVSDHWYIRDTFKTIWDLDRVSGIMCYIFILYLKKTTTLNQYVISNQCN